MSEQDQFMPGGAAPAAEWFAVAAAHEVPPGQIVQTFLHGQEVALWRTSNGAIQAWENRCPHRGTRFTLGRIVDDQLACAYHGWRFGTRGNCTYIPAHPSLTPPKTVCAKTYRAAEQDGIVWVSLGEPRSEAPALAAVVAEPHRFAFCRSFVTYLGADRVLENLASAAYGYRSVASHVLSGTHDRDAASLLLVQPLAPARSALHVWARCQRDDGETSQARRRVCAAVKHQRRRLEALAEEPR